MGFYFKGTASILSLRSYRLSFYQLLVTCNKTMLFATNVVPSFVTSCIQL